MAAVIGVALAAVPSCAFMYFVIYEKLQAQLARSWTGSTGGDAVQARRRIAILGRC